MDGDECEILPTTWNISYFWVSLNSTRGCVNYTCNMATDSELLTDAYLAELLAKDAKAASIKYSAMGLDGYSSKYVVILQYEHPAYLA